MHCSTCAATRVCHDIWVHCCRVTHGMWCRPLPLPSEQRAATRHALLPYDRGRRCLSLRRHCHSVAVVVAAYRRRWQYSGPAAQIARHRSDRINPNNTTTVKRSSPWNSSTAKLSGRDAIFFKRWHRAEGEVGCGRRACCGELGPRETKTRGFSMSLVPSHLGCSHDQLY
jgi:hypothetical protein